MTDRDISGIGMDQVRVHQRAALQTMFAQLATILAADLLLRTLISAVTTRNVADLPYNPAVIRMAGTIASRFLEVFAILVALAILFRITRYGSFAGLGLARRGLKYLPIGLAVPIVALVLASLLDYVVGLLPGVRLLYPGPLPTALALAAATHAAWIEELGFRAVLMQGIERLVGAGSRGRIAAIAVSGLLFASLHLFAPFDLTWTWWIIVTAAGFGLGWAFYAAGRNLWLPIGLHWGFDIGVFLLLGLPGETQGWLLSPVLRPAPALSEVGGLIMLIGTMLTMLTLLPLLNRRRKQEAVS